MKKKIFISIIIGAIFLYISTRSISFSSIDFQKINMNWNYLWLVLLLFVATNLLRAYRLKLLFSHLEVLSYGTVFKFNIIGYAFILILPMRLGEFAIPFLASNSTGIKFSSAVAVIFIERLIDLIALMVFLAYVSFSLINEPWIVNTAIGLGAAILLLTLFLAIGYKKSQFVMKLLGPILKRIPDSIEYKIRSILNEVKVGFKAVDNPLVIVLVFFMSFLVWLISALSIFSTLNLLGIESEPLASLTTMVFNVIGVSIPAGPAMIGNFQYSCILALQQFNIDKSLAFIFSNVYYILNVGLTVLAGFSFLPFTNIQFREVITKLLSKDLSKTAE